MMVNAPLSITKTCDSLFEVGRRPMTTTGIRSIPDATGRSPFHDVNNVDQSSAIIQRHSSFRSKDVSDPNDIRGRYSFSRRRSDRENNDIPLPFFHESKLPAFLEHDRKVLLFNAYYEEEVFQCALEKRRVHVCEIFYYVEDGTIEIILTKQENSGIPQGVFLRRSKIAKPGQTLESCGPSWGNIQYYGINDLKLGSIVEIYSRKFHIVNCNESTKQYVVNHHGWSESDDLVVQPLPRDRFKEANKEKMMRESGVPGVDRNRKMHDLKQVMESMLGKQTSLTDRGMFLECGQDSLCFDVLWDDRERLYGDIQYFKLFYYLADDTVEIRPVHKKNDGRDTFPKLLKRSKLPKSHYHDSSSTSDEDIYYTWTDFAIGGQIKIFGRSMMISRCDSFTREYYLRQGIDLQPDLSLEPEEERIAFERQIPPYNGFGSEEDSLRSCTGGINPPPPKKDLAKMREKSGVILRFNAHLISDKVEDLTRRFVIQFFMEDDTLAIREPPVRNSGVMGGMFLRRQVVKKPNGVRYIAGDFYIGNVVKIVSHDFIILNADEYTYRLMENDCEEMFPYSNFNRLHNLMLEKKNEIKRYFLSFSSPSSPTQSSNTSLRYHNSSSKTNANHLSGQSHDQSQALVKSGRSIQSRNSQAGTGRSREEDGMINLDEFTTCLEKVGLGRLNKQEVYTLWRKINKKNKDRVSFTKVVKLASESRHMSFRWPANRP